MSRTTSKVLRSRLLGEGRPADSASRSAEVNFRNLDLRSDRRAATLIVESAELRIAAVQLRTSLAERIADADLVSQMAKLLEEGSQEYGRVVRAMRRVLRARNISEAREIAQECLRDL